MVVLQDKPVAIVVGGSGFVGYEICQELSVQGYAVLVHYHRSKQKADAVRDIILSQGGLAQVVSGDLTDNNDIDKIFMHADRMGPLSVVVNCAAIDGGRHNLSELSSATLDKVMALNFKSAVVITQLAAQRMRSHNAGVILHISSQLALYGSADLASYAASKAALNSFTQSVARELAKSNIRINNVSPGVMSNSNRADIESLPMERTCTPSDIANAVTWLTDQRTSYVSGVTIPINGAR